MQQERWKPGDILGSRIWHNVRIEIVDVRPAGYGWKYPDLGETAPAGGEN